MTPNHSVLVKLIVHELLQFCCKYKILDIIAHKSCYTGSGKNIQKCNKRLLSIVSITLQKVLGFTNQIYWQEDTLQHIQITLKNEKNTTELGEGPEKNKSLGQLDL